MKLYILPIFACVFSSASSASIRYPRQTWQEPFAVQFQVPSREFAQQDGFDVVFDFQDGNGFEYPDYGQTWVTGPGNNWSNGNNRPGNNWQNGNNRPGNNWSNGINGQGNNRPNGNNRPGNSWSNGINGQGNNRPNGNNRPGNNWQSGNNRPNGVTGSGNNRPNNNNNNNNNAGPGNRPNGNTRPGNNRPNGNTRPGNNRPQTTSPATTTSSTTERASTPRTFHLTPEGCDCPFTPQFNPVCGTDGNTYKNSGLLQCFQRCGIDVNQRRMGAC